MRSGGLNLWKRSPDVVAGFICLYAFLNGTETNRVKMILKHLAFNSAILVGFTHIHPRNDKLFLLLLLFCCCCCGWFVCLFCFVLFCLVFFF